MQDQDFVELDDAGWACLDDAVKRLNESWRTGAAADLARLVPPPTDPLHAPILVKLIAIDQEFRWQSGQPQGLESYLNEWPELRGRPEALVELLSAECLTRAMLGLPPTKAELDSRFPDISGRIDLAAIEAIALRECPASQRAIAGPAGDTSRPTLDILPQGVP
jgi:hypothetical protein